MIKAAAPPPQKGLAKELQEGPVGFLSGLADQEGPSAQYFKEKTAPFTDAVSGIATGAKNIATGAKNIAGSLTDSLNKRLSGVYSNLPGQTPALTQQQTRWGSPDMNRIPPMLTPQLSQQLHFPYGR